jgi:hypothetical protein
MSLSPSSSLLLGHVSAGIGGGALGDLSPGTSTVAKYLVPPSRTSRPRDLIERRDEGRMGGNRLDYDEKEEEEELEEEEEEEEEGCREAGRGGAAAGEDLTPLLGKQASGTSCRRRGLHTHGLTPERKGGGRASRIRERSSGCQRSRRRSTTAGRKKTRGRVWV